MEAAAATEAAALGSVWLKAQAPAGVCVEPPAPRVKSPLPVDLIRGPRGADAALEDGTLEGDAVPWGDVLLDL